MEGLACIVVVKGYVRVAIVSLNGQSGSASLLFLKLTKVKKGVVAFHQKLAEAILNSLLPQLQISAYTSDILLILYLIIPQISHKL